MSKPKAPARKKANGYKMPDPLPKGEILQDIYKNHWILGPSIGKGGFGEIYSAKPADNGSKDYKNVIKIEPHENGPLFVEMHFYTRCARENDVNAFKAKHKLKHLGIPVYIASGSHTHKGEKYRFIVMDRFAAKDIWKLFVENNMKLSAVTVYSLAIQMLYALEYIHSKGYIHGDLKGANILLSESNASKAFLVDFGLAGKYSTDAMFVPNPKRMHNGTIEYLSRDAHQGVQTRRGDIEILVFNMIHWLTGTLPWEGKTDPKRVQQEKEKYMNDIKLFAECFETSLPSSIEDLLSYIQTLKHDQEPDYVKIKNILLNGLHNAGGTENSPLEFISTRKRKSTSTITNGTPRRVKPIADSATKGRNTNNDIEDQLSGIERENVSQKKMKKQTKKRGESSDKEAIENQTPTSSRMNSEELRITQLKAKNSNVKASKLPTVHMEVRKSPRHIGKEPRYYGEN